MSERRPYRRDPFDQDLIDRDLIEHSLRAAARRDPPTPPVTPEEAKAFTLALMRAPYDEALAEGRISPAPDFTGCRIGEIVILGPDRGRDSGPSTTPIRRVERLRTTASRPKPCSGPTPEDK